MEYTAQMRPRILNLDSGDIVVFTVGERILRYEVRKAYLNCDDGDNCAIFDLLGENKHNMAEYAYGYQDCGGDWPTSHVGDYAALTRLVNAIYDKIDDTEQQGMDALATVKIPQNIREGLRYILTLKLERPQVTLEEIRTTIRDKGFQGFDLDALQEILGGLPEDQSFLEYIVAKKSSQYINIVQILPDSFTMEFMEFIMENEPCLGSAIRKAFPGYDPNSMQDVANRLREEGYLKLDYHGFSKGPKAKGAFMEVLRGLVC